MIQLPPDFKEFLKLLNSHDVKYLLIGGYAVGYYGYPRPTGAIDIWVAIHPANADKVVAVLKEFGFDVPGLSPHLFLQERQIIRLGVPPLRLEILTTIDGVAFEECYAQRICDVVEGVLVDFISLPHLKINNRASGRHKDLADLDNLP